MRTFTVCFVDVWLSRVYLAVCGFQGTFMYIPELSALMNWVPVIHLLMIKGVQSSLETAGAVLSQLLCAPQEPLLMDHYLGYAKNEATFLS